MRLAALTALLAALALCADAPKADLTLQDVQRPEGPFARPARQAGGAQLLGYLVRTLQCRNADAGGDGKTVRRARRIVHRRVAGRGQNQSADPGISGWNIR